jgi:hypothetical protein
LSGVRALDLFNQTGEGKAWQRKEFCIKLFFKLDSPEGSYYNNIMVVGWYYSLFSDGEKTKPPDFVSIGGEGGFF